MVNGADDRGETSLAGTGGDKADRLAEALRANLRWRKAQARARRKGAAIEQDEPTAGPDNKNGSGDAS